jgi:8-oxo-dGTP pyrophosphatase MutT (NUDIX family)
MQESVAGEKANFVDQIRDVLRRYLVTFPREANRLLSMADLLAKSDHRVAYRDHFPGHLTSGALTVNWQQKTALLIHHKFLEKWIQPGGHLEGPEEPCDAALRELCEEVGPLEVRLNRWHQINVLPIDISSHAIPPSAAKKEPAHYHHDFLYVFDLVGASPINLQTDEVIGFRWANFAELRAGNYGERLQRVLYKLDKLSA